MSHTYLIFSSSMVYISSSTADCLALVKVAVGALTHHRRLVSEKR